MSSKLISNNPRKPNFSNQVYSDVIKGKKSLSKSPVRENYNKSMNNNYLYNTNPDTNFSQINPNLANIKTLTPKKSNDNYDFGNLCFNVNDDWKALVNKNSKLRQLVIQATDKVQELNFDLANKEKIFEKEKTLIYDELERISQTYKIYAESHKKLKQIQNEGVDNKINNEKAYNNNLVSTYQDHISILIIDYITLFHKIIHYITNLKQISSSQFLFQTKNQILDNLLKYKGIVDQYSFPEIFEEYNNILKNASYYSNIKEKDTRDNNIPLQSDNSQRTYKSNQNRNKSTSLSPLSKKINYSNKNLKNNNLSSINLVRNKVINNNIGVYSKSKSKSKDNSPSRFTDGGIHSNINNNYHSTNNKGKFSYSINSNNTNSNFNNINNMNNLNSINSNEKKFSPSSNINNKKYTNYNSNVNKISNINSNNIYYNNNVPLEKLENIGKNENVVISSNPQTFELFERKTKELEEQTEYYDNIGKNNIFNNINVSDNQQKANIKE